MSGHTKGPFEVCEDSFDDTFYLRCKGAEDDGIFTVERIMAERISKEADAHLFAAAPDLLEALEYALPSLSFEEADKARAAIAKARGEV